MKDVAPEDLNNGFDMDASSKAIHNLLSKAEPATALNQQQRDLYYQTTRISKYSLQFQGCHQIKHWNKDADDEDLRIATKRLVRFRLVPFEKCASYNPWMDASALGQARDLLGQADFGDYIVDLETFVDAYLQTKVNDNAGDDNAGDDGDDGDDGDFDVSDYTQCAALDFQTDDDAGKEYYLGPYCADQGGEIRLNMFTDDTCTTLAKCNGGSSRGATCYTAATGVTLPYTKESIVDNPCIPCSENYNYLNSLPLSEFDASSYDFGYARQSCATLYDAAGKCETHMQDGVYDYGCKYIQGVQIGMSSDGYAVAVRRSYAADAALATLAIGATFLGTYIYYLKYRMRKVNSNQYKSDFYVPSGLH